MYSPHYLEKCILYSSTRTNVELKQHFGSVTATCLIGLYSNQCGIETASSRHRTIAINLSSTRTNVELKPVLHDEAGVRQNLYSNQCGIETRLSGALPPVPE